MRIILYPLRAFPVVNNRIILMNNLDRVYADSPKYVAEYLLSNFNDKFEIIFPVDNLELYADRCISIYM